MDVSVWSDGVHKVDVSMWSDDGCKVDVSVWSDVVYKGGGVNVE